jgi:hypothetical protein
MPDGLEITISPSLLKENVENGPFFQLKLTKRYFDGRLISYAEIVYSHFQFTKAKLSTLLVEVCPLRINKYRSFSR